MSSAILQADALAEILAERSCQPNGLDAGERPQMTSDSLRYLLILDGLTAEDIEVHKTLFEVFNLVRPQSVLWVSIP